jgi:hypothetical protein
MRDEPSTQVRQWCCIWDNADHIASNTVWDIAQPA